MIKSLQIKNYAIIESLEITFSKGLTIITGETGAGKSILLGALGLIMGKRADLKSLYNLDKKCVVEAIFDIRKYQLRPFFDEYDIDYEEELYIRREITPSGKSRAFINDTPVNLKALQLLSGALIDLHQQFDTLDIHDVSFQLKLVDALAENKTRLEDYQVTYRTYQRSVRQLKTLTDSAQDSEKELEFIQFQLEEFQKAALEKGEQEQLEAEQLRLANAEDIKRVLSGAYHQLNESEGAVISQLESIGLALGQLRGLDPKLEKLDHRLESLSIELKDVADELERTVDETEYDPERLQEVQQRLDLIYRLQRKHQVATVDELLTIEEELRSRARSFTDMGAEQATLEKKISQCRKELEHKGAELSARRKAVIGDFEQEVMEMLAQLSMKNATLKVEVHPLREPGPNGLDDVEYLFAANKGGRLQPIKDVASGGELSRLTLVTKSLVASAIPLPSLIFDEIDTGISGDVALKMGNILRVLSDQHQVVSITHSPQVASKADAHYFVYKQDKEDRTVTSVRLLDKEERITTIATMLSQNPPSESAIENAKELLGVG